MFTCDNTLTDQRYTIGFSQNSDGTSFRSGKSEPHKLYAVMKRSPCSHQVEDLNQKGARSFLFLTVPPTDRAPLILQQGSQAINAIAPALADYNSQLKANVQSFQRKHRDLDQVTVFDTVPVFNKLLDNADTFGFVNVTGFCDAYQNGTPGQTTQIAPCAPVSSYLYAE